MAESVTLLDFWPSPFGVRVRIALAAKSIPYTYQEENLFEKGPYLLKMNPIHKKIPVLIHNETPICESLITVEYIDEVWPTSSPLLPTDPYQKSQAKFWADYVDKKVYSCGRSVCMSRGEDQEKAKKELVECLKVLEGELGEKKFFGGEKLGFVDVALVPFYSWFYSYEMCGGFRIGDECGKIVEWAKRCSEVESVKESLPEQRKIYEFIMEMQKKLGIA